MRRSTLHCTDVHDLWRYCIFGVLERSSCGKPLAYKHLDRSGSGVLKAVTYQCWLSARQTCEPNEGSRFYETSLIRTDNCVTQHARCCSCFGPSGSIG